MSERDSDQMNSLREFEPILNSLSETAKKTYKVVLGLYVTEMERFTDLQTVYLSLPSKLSSMEIPHTLIQKCVDYLEPLNQASEVSNIITTQLYERLTSWIDRPYIFDIFIQFGPYLKLYAGIIPHLKQMVKGMEKLQNRHEGLEEAVNDFFSHRKTYQSLVDISTLTTRRTMEYHVFLHNYRNLLDEDDQEFNLLSQCLNLFDDVTQKLNYAVYAIEGGQLALALQDNVISNQLPLMLPGEHLIQFGELVSFEDGKRKNIVHLLVTTLKIVVLKKMLNKYEEKFRIPVAKLRVAHSSAEDYSTEFVLISHIKSIILNASSQWDRNMWIDSLRAAIGEQNIVNLFYLSVHAPPYFPRSRFSICGCCVGTFGWGNPTHCKCCGKMTCSSCLVYDSPLVYLEGKMGKTCRKCFELIGDGDGHFPETTVYRNNDNFKIAGSLYTATPKKLEWRKHWVQLQGNDVCLYKASEDNEPIQIISIPDMRLEHREDLRKIVSNFRKSFFELENKSSSDNIFLFRPTNADEDKNRAINIAKKWISALEKVHVNIKQGGAKGCVLVGDEVAAEGGDQVAVLVGDEVAAQGGDQVAVVPEGELEGELEVELEGELEGELEK